MTFEVTGPTPGLCIHTRQRNVCTRIIGHDGEHLWAADSLNPGQRTLATAARFPVHMNRSEGASDA